VLAAMGISMALKYFEAIYFVVSHRKWNLIYPQKMRQTEEINQNKLNFTSDQPLIVHLPYLMLSQWFDK
jgi:hypothetical protein